jgi:hypothetical chaperone protein
MGTIVQIPQAGLSTSSAGTIFRFSKPGRNMEVMKQIRFQALEPEKIDALIEIVDLDLGYRLYRSLEEAKCLLSEQSSGEFCFSETAVSIQKDVFRRKFESWIALDVQ